MDLSSSDEAELGGQATTTVAPGVGADTDMSLSDSTGNEAELGGQARRGSGLETPIGTALPRRASGVSADARRRSKRAGPALPRRASGVCADARRRSKRALPPFGSCRGTNDITKHRLPDLLELEPLQIRLQQPEEAAAWHHKRHAKLVPHGSEPVVQVYGTLRCFPATHRAASVLTVRNQRELPAAVAIAAIAAVAIAAIAPSGTSESCQHVCTLILSWGPPMRSHATVHSGLFLQSLGNGCSGCLAGGPPSSLCRDRLCKLIEMVCWFPGCQAYLRVPPGL